MTPIMHVPHRIRSGCLLYLWNIRKWICKHCNEAFRTKRSALGHDCEAMK